MLNLKKYKISVIVPVYNIYGYLKNNIESIINQNICMEIIYVNDGSTDDSASIIKKYMEVDDRIKLFQKENGGIGSARNYGLQQASGEYVIFIDGDDYIEKDSLEVLFNSAEQEKLDIVQGCYKKVDDHGNYISGKYNDGTVNVGGCLDGQQWLIAKTVNTIAWLYLFKREYLIENNLWFHEDVFHEDIEYIPRTIYFASRIKAIDLCFYNYVQRDDSFMHTNNIRKSFDLITIADRYKEFLSTNHIENCESDIYIYFNKFLRYLYVSSLNSAILQGFSLREMLKDKELKNKLIFEIEQSNKKEHKIIPYLLKFNLYGIYAILFKLKSYLNIK